VDDVLRAVARDFGTPVYVYFVDQVRARVAAVRAAFGRRFQLSFAVKCNPNHGLLQRLHGVVDLLDVSSGGEVRRALAAGWEAARVSFTGPGKTEAEVRAALDARVGEIVVESVDEAALVQRLAAAGGRRARVLLRIAPARVPRGFGLNMSGKPSQFGIDEEDLDDAVRVVAGLTHVDLAGFHIYSGTQCLNADAIVENYAIFVDLFRRACHTHGLRPHTLIFGAGLGIPYYETDVPLDLAAVASKTNPLLDELTRDPAFAATNLVLETGRYLVGEAGVYLTRVIRTKRSRGVDIAICDGGMHHHLAAAGHLGTLIQRNYRMHKVTCAPELAATAAYTLVGPLCTTIDTIGRQVTLPRLAAGDLIALESSGAYGPTVSPVHFISHPLPREVLVETVDGNLLVEDASQFAAESTRP